MHSHTFHTRWLVLLFCLSVLLMGVLACAMPQVLAPAATPAQQPPGGGPAPGEQPPGGGPPPGEQTPGAGPPGEVQITFTADRTSVKAGECATLEWSVQGGFVADLNGQQVELSGQKQVCPQETTAYTLSVDTGVTMERREVLISVGGTAPPPGPTATSGAACSGAPAIPSFTASPGAVNSGQSSTLSWGLVTNATTVVIDQGIGGVGTPGSKVVTPAATTTYTMTATGCGGTTTKQATVTVGNILKIVSADLAVTDIYADKLPQGKVFIRITNNGPDSLTSASATLACQVGRTPVGGGVPTASGSSGPITVSLNAGQTSVFDTGITVDTSQFKYSVECSISFLLDPKASNNSYSEQVPP